MDIYSLFFNKCLNAACRNEGILFQTMDTV